MDENEVIAMLEGLLEKANEVEADVGTAPTAQEALTWAIDEIKARLPA